MRFLYLLLTYLFLLFVPLMANTVEEVKPLFLQETSSIICAVVINERDTSDTLIFELEADMVLSLLYESGNVRQMDEIEVWYRLENLEPFTIAENIFQNIKEHGWSIQPSARLDSIYSIDGITGVIEECFYTVDGYLYMKSLMNKNNAPIVWMDFCWDKLPGDHTFYADCGYIVYLLQKHHLYTCYTTFLNIKIFSNINISIPSIEYESRFCIKHTN